MIKISTESTIFNISQRLADQASMILIKSWFPDFEILEIGKHMSWKESLTENETQNTENQNTQTPKPQNQC